MNLVTARCIAILNQMLIQKTMAGRLRILKTRDRNRHQQPAVQVKMEIRLGHQLQCLKNMIQGLLVFQTKEVSLWRSLTITEGGFTENWLPANVQLQIILVPKI